MGTMTPKTILLIHKNPHLREVLQACLTDLGGWSVQVASSTLDGLQQAKLSQPDAIIWEFPIKERQGILFLKKLREQPETSQTPVVALILRAKWLDLQQSCFQDYQVEIVIVNPFDLARFSVQIANALGWDEPDF